MIKKSLFENDIIMGMQTALNAHNQAQLPQAAEYLHSAIDLFNDCGMQEQAQEVFTVLLKIAKKHHSIDPHIKNLTDARQIANLLEHGHQFNLADDSNTEDLLNLDVNLEDPELEIFDDEVDFEDEK